MAEGTNYDVILADRKLARQLTKHQNRTIVLVYG
jgi:hypothetical protein